MTSGDRLPSELIDDVVALVRSRFGPAMAVLAERYFADVPHHDLRRRTAAELFGAVGSHLELARHRAPGQVLIRAYSPTIDEDGWQSRHSIVDLVLDDSPFIVATAMMTLARLGHEVHLLVHPVLEVERDKGVLFGPSSGIEATAHEAFVHLEIDRTSDPRQLKTITDELSRAMAAVSAAVADWPAMVHRAEAVAHHLEKTMAASDTEAAEAVRLLRWMAAGEFVFLGARDYEYGPDDQMIRSVPGTGLGLLANRPASARPLASLSPAGVQRVLGPDVLLITKTNTPSPIHRPGPMDYVGIRLHDPDTGTITEHRFIGLFTAPAYTESVTRIPVIGPKVQAIIERTGFTPGTHDANRLLTVIEEHPRDELFQASIDELAPMILDIVHLYDRQAVRLFVRPEAFGRSVSCLVFVPRDRYRTEVREAIQDALEDAFGGSTIHFEASVSSSPLARLYVVVATAPSPVGDRPVDPPVDPYLDLAPLERRIEEISRTWDDSLRDALIDHVGQAQGTELADAWSGAFPTGYREDREPTLAIIDILRLEALANGGHGDVAIRSYHPTESDPAGLRVKLYRVDEPVSLSDFIPILHHHGAKVLDERPYRVRRNDGHQAWIHDFGLQLPRSATENMRQHGEAIRRRFEDSLLAVWEQRAESDRFAELVLGAGLTWRDVMLVRGLARYLRQTGATFTPSYLQEIVTAHPGTTSLIIERFHRRLDPERLDPSRDEELAQWVVDALDAIPRLDEDRILRAFNNLVEATVRTNLYQHDRDGQLGNHLVLKLDPSRVADLPEPRPRHEIFVTSPRVEGVHLRAGRIARGGLRWSDRKEDFRTEVLALLKAQAVKNAVIVPVGAKGGFICRQLPEDDLAAERAEVEACYRTFVGGLLDVTDNLVDGVVVPPPDVVRLDGDDPYLVVAADRGTSGFSDLANAIATERGFWLGDAFASGGSNGYDHKAMGITARGAWVSVRRHLSEMGLDPERQPITVVGIGDMSGDVFGNGMLRSRHLRLVAAFDHRHVFIDPDPDPAATYAERQRLFNLPGSTWGDFDRSLLSPGGVIAPRTAKRIILDEQAAAALGCPPGAHTPNEVVNAILTAPVDLLWNGGIGTYVKASTESHESVGDRANDAVRVDADDLRCRVVGEGGNLGFTQRGRIEAALGGVRINTDAIDNSGGVNTSDREVNLKILLDQLVKSRRLTREQRNDLLAEMTDDIATRVLADNAAQALALTSARIDAPGMTQVHIRLMAWLERHGGLDRAIEALPTDEEVIARQHDGQGMTQPELAVLMAYTKNVVTEMLVDSDLPDEPDLARELDNYLPEALAQRFPDALSNHPLRRELLATHLANRLVNEGGMTMALRLGEQTAATVAEVTRSHIAAWRLFDLEARWDRIQGLEGQVDPRITLDMFLSTTGLGERVARWLIQHREQPLAIDAVVAELGPAVAEVASLLSQALSETTPGTGHRERSQRWIAAGVPEDLATTVALNALASTVPDIVAAARAVGCPLDVATRVYFLVDDQLGLSWLRHKIDELPRTEMWSSLARTAMRDDLFLAHAELVRLILADPSVNTGSAEERVKRWEVANQEAIERAFDVLVEIRSVREVGIEHVGVGLREVRNLLRRTAPPTHTVAG